ENVCLTCNPPLLLNDGTYKIFLNTAAEDLSLLDPELKLFYDYIRRGTADSTLTEKIDNSINELKENREARRKYMTYTTRIAEAKNEAREEGISIGITQGAHQKAVETAKVLKSAGIEINLIINSTGLSPEEIEKL
ncbi:MAG: hypothetical protein J6B11_10640, partial [Spirochaetales bacterium]|nr:hypothetical protein [Spirochaetales bacterium]